METIRRMICEFRLVFLRVIFTFWLCFDFCSVYSSVDDDPSVDVMLRAVQDPELRPIYEGLPDLGCVIRRAFSFTS
jgi:hypothetical protein